MKISIVLPAKNEALSVGLTVRRIRECMPDAEIIVVNDGSTDDTAQIAEQASASVVSHPYSKGNGAAIKTGARAAGGDIIVFMDADGQHDPADISRLLEKMEQGNDLVVGARQKGSQASLGRGLANGLYNSCLLYTSDAADEMRTV
ncbi:glycosyltransferase family 2 protein [Delftia sp. ASV31]|uniref:glycosyltransferase family 2 protein n=1 Tax=Delftia sp. ASV31 TaxID=2795113 RepID=UPI0018ED304A|nr:glycosyltransferase family 2 protein [Delftia sp. ASV31]